MKFINRPTGVRIFVITLVDKHFSVKLIISKGNSYPCWSPTEVRIKFLPLLVIIFTEKMFINRGKNKILMSLDDQQG